MTLSRVGIPESFKVGWYPPKKLGRVTLSGLIKTGFKVIITTTTTTTTIIIIIIIIIIKVITINSIIIIFL